MEKKAFPVHVGIIMDGNGRWAKKRGLPRQAGHAAGAQVFRKITKYCEKFGIQYLTVYAFSTENWSRPKEEVDAIMDLLRQYLKESLKVGGCGECQTSCQSACKTSCTVANQHCENKNK